jgi:hypothetical protein
MESKSNAIGSGNGLLRALFFPRPQELTIDKATKAASAQNHIEHHFFKLSFHFNAKYNNNTFVR